MELEVKNTIKAEIADLKENLNGQQERLTHLLEILEKEERGAPERPVQDKSTPIASGFDITIDGESRKDITRDELKIILESFLDLTHVKHPELEITISDVESETNAPVTLTTQQIGKGMRHDDSISILDKSKRLIGDIQIEFSVQGIKGMRAQYYKAYWGNK